MIPPINTFVAAGVSWEDWLNIAIRLAILFVLGITSTLTIQKRFYQMSLFLFGVWMTFFRLTTLRVILLYIGIFRPEETAITTSQVVYNFFQSSRVSNVVSFIVLVGAVLMFYWIKKFYDTKGGKP